MAMIAEYTHFLADAYYAAALADADMREAARRLESIHTAMTAEQGYFPLWLVIDRQIGKAKGTPLQQALVNLRAQFEQYVSEQEVQHLRASLQRSPEQGWRDWLSTFGMAFTRSRLLLCKSLCDADLPFPEQYRPQAAKLEQAIRYILRDYYGEAYDTYLYLGGQDILLPDDRTDILVDAAKIQLYFLYRYDKAKGLLERAATLAARESVVKGGWGLYWLLQARFDKAQTALTGAIELDPSLVGNYLLMGDCYERQNKLEEAETWYRKGIETNEGESGAYIRLLRLYSRTEWFETHKDALQELLEKANRVDPLSTYSNYIEMGYTYQQNKNYPQSDTWYLKAVDLDDICNSAYLFIGSSAQEQGNYDRAEEMYRKAIEKAPDLYEGYWNMGLLFEQKEQWSEALSWYEQGQHHLKEMESAFRAKIGEMLLKQQEYVEAEKQLFETLRDDPGSQAVVTPLENLAEVYYQQQKNLSEAQRVYGSIKQIKEQANDYSYEAPYQNLLGNASYYFGDYRSAQNAYETAIEASPDDGILYSNLSQAWENIKEPGNRLVALENAVLALRKALELSPGAADFASRLENLEFQYRMARRLGESAFALSPTMSVLQVGVALDLVSYLVEGAESGELSKAVQEQVDGLRKRMRENVGLILPGINFKDIPGAGEGQYTLYLSDTPLVGGVLPQGRRFSPHSAEELAPLSVAPLEDDDPVIGGKGCWVAAADWASIEARGLTLWQIMEYPLRHLEALLKSDPSVLIDHQQAMWWLDVAKTDKAKTIKESPEKRSSLLHVLRALTHESVPVTAVDLICDTFLEGKMAGASLVSIAELLRSKPEIRPTLAGNNEQYTFYHLSADLEAELARLFHKDEAQPLLIMEIAQFQELMGTLAQVTFPPHSALLVETAELRPFVRKIIETSFPKIPVLSVQELLPGLERNIANTKEAQPVVVDGAGASSDAESEIVAVNIENSSQKESASHE